MKSSTIILLILAAAAIAAMIIYSQTNKTIAVVNPDGTITKMTQAEKDAADTDNVANAALMATPPGKSVTKTFSNGTTKTCRRSAAIPYLYCS